MYAGIDFGTSNCSIGVWKNNAPSLIPLERNSFQLPSAFYTVKDNVELERIDTDQLAIRVGEAKRRQSLAHSEAERQGRKFKALSLSELENIERGQMRREIAERAKAAYEGQTIKDALYSDSEVVFGTEAIERHIAEPLDGYYAKSPKSFLGADLRPMQIQLFTEICTRMLVHIREKSIANRATDIDNIVLGRPVNFHGTRGEVGNTQAVNILHSAAISAGFKEVDFMMEPVAAALDFERQITQDTKVLVLDVGGGTTDCSMINIGPSFRDQEDRNGSILGYSGDRKGGLDLDVKLAFHTLMPLFGKESTLTNGKPIPNHLFWDAVAINDISLLTGFASMQTGKDIEDYLQHAAEPDKLDRLLYLHEQKLSRRIGRSAEQAKIQLSDQSSIALPLDYVEKDLGVTITREQFKHAITRELDTFVKLMKEAEAQAGTAPDAIYVTGGTAKSPTVDAAIREAYPNTEVIIGDAFGSVASGLTTWAHKLYA